MFSFLAGINRLILETLDTRFTLSKNTLKVSLFFLTCLCLSVVLASKHSGV